MLNFEKYLSDFNSTISLEEFVLNLVLTTVIVYLLKLFYIKFGNTVSDRAKFSNNFIPLALATLLIITVIKSSIALSLGLVGALSIVRFRAAIKDPEELTMLFLVIGFGLIGGANKPILSIVSFIFILPILFFNFKISKQSSLETGKTYLNINTSRQDLLKLTDSLAKDVSYLELRRSDISKDGMFVSYMVQLNEPGDILKIQNMLQNFDADIRLSIIDQSTVSA